MIGLACFLAFLLGVGVATFAAARWRDGELGQIASLSQELEAALSERDALTRELHQRAQAAAHRAEAIEQSLLREKWQGNASGIIAPSRKLIT